jgi:Uma2 family endonuclease
MGLPHESSEERMARRRSSVRLTYDDYVHFPDDKRYELIDGEAYVLPSPNRRHQEILLRLAFLIESHLREHPVGRVYIAPFDVVLTESDIVQPDIVYVSNEDADVLTDANIWGTPTWAIEVLSPSTRSRDLTLKRKAYERTGLGELWFVDPEADSVQVLVLREGRYEERAAPAMVRPEAVPGLEIDLGEALGD